MYDVEELLTTKTTEDECCRDVRFDLSWYALPELNVEEEWTLYVTTDRKQLIEITIGFLQQLRLGDVVEDQQRVEPLTTPIIDVKDVEDHTHTHTHTHSACLRCAGQ